MTAKTAKNADARITWPIRDLGKKVCVRCLGGTYLGHLALYALPAVIIALGWAETDFGGHGVTWFGVAMPKLLPTMESL
jgi:hypothetical protein